MKKCSKLAIVTGASSGIGREFVWQLAKKSASGLHPLDEIWVIARREERLKQLAQEIERSYNKQAPKIVPLSLDLNEEGAFDTMKKALQQHEADENLKLELHYMINAAGWGAFGQMQKANIADQCSMIKVNCRALVEGCYHALAYAVKGSRIINVASSAGFVPMPGGAVYAASKSFVLFFSRALNQELKSVGITSTAVCPKACDTEFFEHMGEGRHMERSIKLFGVEQPIDVVRCALRDADKGKDLSISSIEGKALHALGKVVPYNLAAFIERKLGM